MSLLTLIVLDEKFLISCDSRASMKKGEDYLTLNDDAQKIRHVKEYAIFTSGVNYLIDQILEKFSNSVSDSLFQLQKICREETEEFKRMLREEQDKFDYIPELTEEDYCALFIMYFKDGMPHISKLCSLDNYKIEHVPLDNGNNTFLFGCEADEAIEYYRENATADILDSVEIFHSFLTGMYQAVECKEVGGTVYIYELSKENNFSERKGVE